MDEKEAEQKSSLRKRELKVNRASETEGQRKEWLRIRNEKDRAKKVQEENKRSDSIYSPADMCRILLELCL